jgi:ABC-type uncharacterized transport system substrate-binding protein
MFIDVSLKFMLTDSGLGGVYVYWQLDEMNSAWIIEDYDKDRNGALDKKEQQAIFIEAFSNAASQNYFISMSWGLNIMDTVRIDEFSAVINNSKNVQYSFYIPCTIALKNTENMEIYMFFDDPTIYIAFDLLKNLIQVSSNAHIKGSISFKKIDYSDAVVLRLQRK